MTHSPLLPDFAHPDTLLPAIAQDVDTGQVLMLAYMNRDAYEETLRTGYAVYFSRSRGRLWRKGEESGHRQQVVKVCVDCDGDTLLLLVKQLGAACHEGYRTCFFREWSGEAWIVHQPRLVDPADVYPPSDNSSSS